MRKLHRLEKRNLLPEDLKPIESLEDYKKIGGLKGLEKARSMPTQAVIDEVKASGLRGRGGAGFPTAIKWQTVHDADDEKKYIVCNLAEGEPGTNKDRYFLTKNPYWLFEGILIAAYAIGAREAIIGTKEKFKRFVPILERALKEFEEAGVVEPGYIRMVYGPDEYLLGEEKALLEVVDGRMPMPRFFPPYMVGVGVGPTETNPTVVNNAESLSHLPNIIARGSDWFRSLGSEDTPGTVILSLSGDLKTPGMYEVEPGMSVREMLYDLGGGPRDPKHEIKGVFSGASNRVMTPDQFDLEVGFGTLRAGGVGLGSGGFVVYDDRHSMVDICHMFIKFLAVASCGQCIPCNSGTRQVMQNLEELKFGRGSQANIDNIIDICGRCTDQTRCFLPQQCQIVTLSMIEKFRVEFDRCAAGHPTEGVPDLIIPKIDYFDDEEQVFVLESNPKEFRPEFAINF